MPNNQTERLITKAIASIESGELSQARIIAYYENVSKSTEATDLQKERVAEAVEAQLRRQFPARANRLFGRADGFARAKLQVLLEATKSELDLSNNRVKTTVKTGGDQLRGDYLVDTYISYKNEEGHRASIEVRQQTAVTPTFVIVRVQDVPADKCVLEQRFEQSDYEAAATMYRTALVSLLAGLSEG